MDFSSSGLSASPRLGKNICAAVLVPGVLTGSDDFEPLCRALTERGLPTVAVQMPTSNWLPCMGGRSMRPILERIDFTVKHLVASNGDVTKIPSYEYSLADALVDFKQNPGGVMQVGGAEEVDDYPEIEPRGNFPLPPEEDLVGKGKVALIGHSAGGWISRVYLSAREYGGKAYQGSDYVHSLVTLGAPHANAAGPAFKGIAWANEERVPVPALSIAGRGFKGDEWGSLTQGSYSFCCPDASDDGTSYDGDGLTPVFSSLAMEGAEQMILDDVGHYPWSDIWGGSGDFLAPELTKAYKQGRPWYGSDEIVDKWVGWVLDHTDDTTSEGELSEGEIPSQVETDHQKSRAGSLGIRSRKKGLMLPSSNTSPLPPVPKLRQKFSKLRQKLKGKTDTTSEVKTIDTTSEGKIPSQVETDDQKSYAKFLDMKHRKKALNACEVFSALEPSDLDRLVTQLEEVHFSKSTNVLTQGNKNGDDMYFVVDGKFECYNKKTGEVLKVCGPMEYFGELALFLSTPRALSVRSATDSTTWRLTRECLDSAVQDSALDEKVLEVLKNAYKKESIWGTLPDLSLSELRDLLVLKSRPTKKPVSLHSIVSILATGFFLASMLPLFAPGSNEELDLVQILGASGQVSPEVLRTQSAAMWLLAISGVMGMFRLPPRSPPCRTIFFLGCASANVSTALVCSSNLTGARVWFLDGFAAPWNVIIPLATIFNLGVFLWAIDDSITGPIRGRDTIPGTETRTRGVLVNALMAFGVTPIVQVAIAPWYSDKATFVSAVVPFIQNGGLEGSQFSIFASAAGGAAAGALLATLRFERKLDATPALALAVAAAIFFNFDAFAITWRSLKTPETFIEINSAGAAYYIGVAEQFHLFDGVLVACGLVALNAWRRVKMRDAAES